MPISKKKSPAAVALVGQGGKIAARTSPSEESTEFARKEQWQGWCDAEGGVLAPIAPSREQLKEFIADLTRKADAIENWMRGLVVPEYESARLFAEAALIGIDEGDSPEQTYARFEMASLYVDGAQSMGELLEKRRLELRAQFEAGMSAANLERPESKGK